MKYFARNYFSSAKIDECTSAINFCSRKAFKSLIQNEGRGNFGRNKVWQKATVIGHKVRSDSTRLGKDCFLHIEIDRRYSCSKTKSGTKPDWEHIQEGGKYMLTASEISPNRVMTNEDLTFSGLRDLHAIHWQFFAYIYRHTPPT